MTRMIRRCINRGMVANSKTRLSPQIDWDDKIICGSCDGTGCGLCGGTGEVHCPILLHVTCACGWDCDGETARSRLVDGQFCPDCGLDLDKAISDTDPTGAEGEPDYEPDDYCGTEGWFL